MHQLRGGHMGLGTKPILEATLIVAPMHARICLEKKRGKEHIRAAKRDPVVRILIQR